MALLSATRLISLLSATVFLLSVVHADLQSLLSSQIDPAVADPSWTVPVVNVTTNTMAFTTDDLQGIFPPNSDVPPDACTGTNSRTLGSNKRPLAVRRYQFEETRRPVNRRLLGPPRIPVDYNGGPILQTVNVYMIYVQAESASDWSWTDLPNYFVTNLQNSSRWQTMTNFYMVDNNGDQIFYQGSIQLSGVAQLTLPDGTAIRDGISCGQGPDNTVDNFANLIGNAIVQNAVPLDPNGLYLIAPNLDTALEASYGNCGLLGPQDQGDCGWHTFQNFPTTNGQGVDIVYGYVPYATKCGCGLDDRSVFRVAGPPSGNQLIDGFIDTLLHELEESTADPYTTKKQAGWNTLNDPNHQGEIADVCTADLKPVLTTTVNGQDVVYNAVIGGVPFIVHNGYDAATQMCEAALPSDLGN